MRAKRKIVRRSLLALLTLAVSLVALRVVSLQGLIKPVRIASGSMAPALLGPRRQAVCRDCGYRWTNDAAQTPADDSAVCPNCGCARNTLASSLLPGEPVLIDRGAYWLRAPRRFEAAALGDPAAPERLTVKRIVALPGESLEVRGGELIVNGRFVRKSLAQFRELAVPVHDDRFCPKDSTLPPRWRDPQGQWSRSGGTHYYAGDFQSADPLASNPQFAWLAYHHWRCSALPGLRTKESPVLDDDGYNLGPPRQLNVVADLALRCRIQTIGAGCLAVALRSGGGEWQIRIRPRQGDVSLWRDGKKVATGTFSRRWDEAFVLEAAICDGRILAAIDGKEVLAHICDAADELEPSSQPFALGAAGLAVEASELNITRDVYYLPPPGRGNWKIGPLGKDQYVLLGDNAAISQDSRTWSEPAVNRARLLGPVLPIFRKLWPG
jgi:signal peptidase I